MRIEDLKIFVDVVRYHSMNVASERNFTTPQNLSRIIKRMEDELGIVLFNRSIRGSDLTEDGERFYYRVIEILYQYDQALREIQGKVVDLSGNSSEKKHVSILCSQGLLSYAVANAYQSMQEKEPGLVLDQKLGAYELGTIVDQLNNKDYDLITLVLLDPSLEMMAEKLSDYVILYVLYDEVVIVVNKDSSLGQLKTISFEDLKNYKMIAINNKAANLEILGPDFSYHILTNSIQAALGYVEYSSIYCTLMGRSALMNYEKLLHRDLNLRMIPLEKKKIASYVVLLHSKNLENKAMIDFARRIAENFW